MHHARELGEELREAIQELWEAILELREELWKWHSRAMGLAKKGRPTLHHPRCGVMMTRQRDDEAPSEAVISEMGPRKSTQRGGVGWAWQRARAALAGYRSRVRDCSRVRERDRSRVRERGRSLVRERERVGDAEMEGPVICV